MNQNSSMTRYQYFEIKCFISTIERFD